MLLPQVLMVHFVRTANGPEIDAIGITQPFEALMNEDVVYQKVGEPVDSDTGANKH